MSYLAVILITILAFASGYAFAIYSLSKRISFDRYVVLEHLYLTTVKFMGAADYDEVELYGEKIQTIMNTLTNWQRRNKVNE